MEIVEVAEFSSNLAQAAEILQFVLPVAAGLAGLFGIAALAFGSLVRRH